MARAPKSFRARFELPAEEEIEVTDDTSSEPAGDGEPMTDEQLASLVDEQINDSKSYESNDLIQLREKALKYFEGGVDFDSQTGRSSVVSRDVSDIHGLIMPGLMRVFLATDNIAIYNPTQQSDEKFARQATDYINYVVMKECGGYIQFRSAFHDGLLMGNGIIKHWWDDTPVYTTESFSGLSDDAYTQLAMDPDVEEVLEHTEYDDPNWVPPPPMPPMMGAAPMGGMGAGGPPVGTPPSMPPPPPPMPMGGMGAGGPPMGMPPMPPMGPGGVPSMGMPPEMPVPQAPMLHDCKIKRKTSSGRLRVMALAPEDLLLGRGVISLDEENIRFVAHHWLKTRSVLIKQGFDKDTVYDLPAYTSANPDTPEQLQRDRNHLFEGDTAPDKSTDLIEGYECYVQCDYDGDGVAEWRQVNVSGLNSKRALLSNEEWGDDLPFSDIVPDPVPHRWRGRSLLDTIGDIQDIKTVVMRQTLDNLYLSNNPRQKVIENAVVDLESIKDFEIAQTVLVRQADAVTFDQIPFVAEKSFPILEYLDQMAEKRTGASRSSVALDPEALQEQTATAVTAMQAAASTKVEEYARNIAEHGGLRRIFSKVLKLVVKHQDRARTVRLRDDWVEVDPRAWNADMDVTINVGLGSGSRERDLTILMGIAAKQEQVILQLGPTNPVLGLDRLFKTYRLMVEAGGVKPSDQFFPEISPEVMQQMAQASGQHVDPKVQAEQMRAQLEAQKMQVQAHLDQQAQQSKAQLDAQIAAHKQQLDTAKAQQEAQLQQMQFERQAQVEERQAQADIAVQQASLRKDIVAQQAKLENDRQMAAMKFEFQKKLEMLKLYSANRLAQHKNAVQAKSDSEAQADTDAAASEGNDAMNLVADSQTTLAGALADFMQKLTDGQVEHSKKLTSAIEGLSKPKRQRIIRDENGQVIGAETIT